MGKKKVTMKDIAEKLNISINAVSLALNDKNGVSDETRSVVFRTAADLGYFHGNPVFMGGSMAKNLCLMIEDRYFKDLNFYSKVILGIEKEARFNNYDIIVNMMDRSNYIVPESVETRKVSGILIIGEIENEYLGKILKYNIPILLVDYASNKMNVDAVLTQNIAGTYMAVNYLKKMGHKNIGFFGDINYSSSFRERWLGYCEIMGNREKNYEARTRELYDWSLIGPVYKYINNKDYDTIGRLVLALNEMPSAWVCANDDAAVALCNVLSRLNIKVPEDVSVIGFDDVDLCKLVSPNLTTMRVNKELMGRSAVKNLLWRMNHEDEPCFQLRLGVSLIERDSVLNISLGKE